MQKLDVFQSLWAMEVRHPRTQERSIDENFAMVAEAGYAGLCLDPAIDEIDDTARLKPYFERYGLKCMMNVFPRALDELRPLLELAWVELFRNWWTEGMRDWRRQHADDAALIFLCELGPPGYAITDVNGNELSDRWHEAAVIRAWAEDIWRQLEAESNGPDAR